MKSRAAVDDRPIIRKISQSSLKAGVQTRNSLGEKSSLYEVFHENTKLGPLTMRAHLSWSANYLRMRRGHAPLQAGKVYTLMEGRALPKVPVRNHLEETIAARRSLRAFSGESLRLEELARLLAFSYGPTEKGGRCRAVSSGGALYPLEIYVVALAIDELEPGVYHFGADTHHLDVVRLGDCRARLQDVVYLAGIDHEHAAAAIVITAAFRRSTIKYLDRGYRMVLFEAGEVMQNLCLLATSMGFGGCLLGGFQDDHLSEFLEIDGVEEAPLVAMMLGKPPAAATAAQPGGADASAGA